MKKHSLIEFVRDLYDTSEFIPLHSPVFKGNEKKYIVDTIDSTFVSSVGKYVDDLERGIERYTGAKRAVATVNGTAALHTALYLAGIQYGDLVITQALTFVATCNALYHMGAHPIFLDISPLSLGLCPKKVAEYLEENCYVTEEGCFYKKTKQRIKAILPMHTFGHPVELDELIYICNKWGLKLIEDAAESLGSFYKKQHTGTIGEFAAISFNGNKVMTTGGGGMILCVDEKMGIKAKHITTTAKVTHNYEFFHNEPGFNYRMPNLNAALGCAQLEQLNAILESKRKIAEAYKLFFSTSEVTFVEEPNYGRSNYWLNAIICPDHEYRDALLIETNASGVMTRPVWKLMHHLPMYKNALRGDLSFSEYIESHLLNLPSSPIINLDGNS